MFELFNKRTPVLAIANILNDKGYRTKYRRVERFNNKKYGGKQGVFREIKHKSKWYDGLHDAIISQEEVFEKAQKILKERSIKNEKYKIGKKYRAPLAGMISCFTHCTAKYHWKTNRKKQRRNISLLLYLLQPFKRR